MIEERNYILDIQYIDVCNEVAVSGFDLDVCGFGIIKNRR